MPQPNPHFAERTVHAAYTELLKELEKLKATQVQVSSNVTLGPPPKDKGVCVYFILKNKPYALPCDKWDRAEDNLWALAKHIEALRGQERWGVGTIERAFAGYLALGDGRKTWREVLGFTVAEPLTRERINTRRRELAAKNHPDLGGNTDVMAEMNRACDEALKEVLV